MAAVQVGDAITLPGVFSDIAGSGFSGSEVTVTEIIGETIVGTRMAGGVEEKLQFKAAAYWFTV